MKVIRSLSEETSDRENYAEMLLSLSYAKESIAEYRSLVYDFHDKKHVDRLTEIWKEHEYGKRPAWYKSNKYFMNNNEQFSKYEIGDFTYSMGLTVDSVHTGCTLKIGKFCSIAGGVQCFLQQEHNIRSVSTYTLGFLPGFPSAPALSKGDIVIGNDVWIGAYSRILSGVTIGDGAVIGLGSLVTKDVAPYAVVGGVPAKTIRQRYADHVVDRLLDLRWWGLDFERIRMLGPYLAGEDIELFLAKAEELRQ